MQRVHIRQPPAARRRLPAAESERPTTTVAANAEEEEEAVWDRTAPSADGHLRENFCGLCAAVPIAFAGLVGGATSGASLTAKQYTDRKVLTLVACAFFVVLSLILLARYWGCASCAVTRG
jgi:hypothetical protein